MDRGTWEPHVDVEEGLAKGSLKFALHGEKLKGNWALVRMANRSGNKPNWLLIKEHDAEEHGPGDTPITEAAPDSVLTGRDIDAIAKDEDRVWHSNHTGARDHASKNGIGTTLKSTAHKPAIRNWNKEISGAPKEKLPAFIEPQLAVLAKAPPESGDWVYEIKLDGYRIQARIDSAKHSIQLLTRTGLDWTHRMRPLAELLRQLRVTNALLDGEVVVLRANGTSSFADLQTAFQEGTKHDLTYFVFDLLHLDGHNLRNLPLTKRKQILERILSQAPEHELIRLSEHITGGAKEIFAKACELKTEGIIAKRANAIYAPGRGES
jgi:bifunctional non-homologous end joining protein LigD